jgi:Zn-dependent peptidase ImmA (M78 family)
MRFSDLYEYSNSLPEPTVSVRELANRIRSSHQHVGEINFYPVDLDEDVSLGHIVYERDRSSPYEGEFTVANIRFSRQLNRCWRRFVCCKELMHLFDSDDERTNTRAKFVQLMNELETPPLAGDMSPMLSSEYEAEWMALTVLCPARLRDAYRDAFHSGELPAYEVAAAFRVPEAYVPALMSDYYKTALSALLR